MQKLMKMMHRNEKGFTLVELMVVVVIIGILVAIAIPVFGVMTRNAERRSVEANLRTLDGAIAAYYASEGPAAPALGTLEDLEGDYIAAIPVGPGEVEYGITGTAPNQRATVEGDAAGVTIPANTSLPIDWDTLTP